MVCMFRNSKEVPVFAVKSVDCAINDRASLTPKTYTYMSLIYMNFQTPWLIFCTAREGCVLHKPTRAHTGVGTLGGARSPAHLQAWPCATVL